MLKSVSLAAELWIFTSAFAKPDFNAVVRQMCPDCSWDTTGLPGERSSLSKQAAAARMPHFRTAFWSGFFHPQPEHTPPSILLPWVVFLLEALLDLSFILFCYCLKTCPTWRHVLRLHLGLQLIISCFFITKIAPFKITYISGNEGSPTWALHNETSLTNLGFYCKKRRISKGQNS